MKDMTDTRTVDLVGDLKRGRGRPVSGTALTPAERQKQRRERLRASGIEPLTVMVDSEVAAALRKFGQFKEETLGQIASRLLRDRLLRPR